MPAGHISCFKKCLPFLGPEGFIIQSLWGVLAARLVMVVNVTDQSLVSQLLMVLKKKPMQPSKSKEACLIDVHVITEHVYLWKVEIDLFHLTTIQKVTIIIISPGYHLTKRQNVALI